MRPVNCVNKLINRRGKKHSNKGFTMMAAIIIMTILVVLAFSLMLVSYTLYASQNKNNASMRCAEAANTLSNALDEELTYIERKHRSPETDSYLYKYLRYNICQADTWPYYNPSDEGHGSTEAFRYFDLKYNSNKTETDPDAMGSSEDEEAKTVDIVQGMPGRTVVCIYWTPPVGYNKTNYSNENIASLSASQRQGITLYVEVTCEMGSQSYTVLKKYSLNCEGKYDDEDEWDLKRHNALTNLSGNDKMINPTDIPSENLKLNEVWKWESLDEE